MNILIAEGYFHCSNCGNWSDVKIKKGHISIVVPKEDLALDRQIVFLVSDSGKGDGNGNSRIQEGREEKGAGLKEIAAECYSLSLSQAITITY